MKRKREEVKDCDWTLKFPLKLSDLSITKKKVTLVSETFKQILNNNTCMILGKLRNPIKNI